MRVMYRGILIVTVLLLAGSPLYARAAGEARFLAEFEGALVEQGFTAEEAAAIAEAARTLDWSAGRRADPQMIARAMSEIDEENGDLAPLEQAQIALALATNAVGLRRDGYSATDVAEATLAAVATLHEQITAWREGGGEEQLGEIVRDTVRGAVESAAREAGDEPDAPAEGTPAEGTPAEGRVPAVGGNR